MRISGRAILALWSVVLGAWLLSPPFAAGRDRVLKQIDLPHHYYYREMYVPQVTSGPGSVCWSPDGRALAFPMQGTLWKQRLGTSLAEQLTSGPGYDSQPDWSPDGRFIAYASYQNDAVELWVLDLSTGKSAPLTRNGAVNLEPRWSPDGRRLAFVSTLYEGRWHIYRAEFERGRLRNRVRLTQNHRSDLPRYYYSPFDHYLSPTWSPDGAEILFVSNRGRVWGTGGFWRMRAEPQAPMREIHYEETTWKAKPDWSPDGRRVIYSSYLGRQWHQLWIMTDEGGDVFPLTYGDHDVTNARWSPGGGRIAYISNQGGNTSLWVQEIPGGRRRKITHSVRRYQEPIAQLRIRVLDAADGRMIPARISVTGPDGKSHAPDDAWRHADDSFDRSEREFEYSYFHTTGSSELTVPAGRLEVEILRGPEYRIFRRTITPERDSTHALEARLERLDDLAARGWISADLHVHMNYGGTYRNTPERLALQAAAEDLHVVENLIVNKEQRIPDIAYFTGEPDPSSSADLLIVHGQEFHTSTWGHTGLLGLEEHLLLPDYASYANTAAASLYPPNAIVLDLAHAQGALTGYVHPFDSEPDPADLDTPLMNELPVDAALGKVDYYEAVGFNERPLATARVWYRLLNCGFRIPAGGGTDAMANYASLRGPVGMNRVYVRMDPPLEHKRFLAALKAGRSFATNGPLLEFTLAGKQIGDELRLPAGSHTLEARVALRSIAAVDHLEVIGNGKIVASIPLSEDRTSASATVPIRVEESGWYLLRARAEEARHPVLDFMPYATTSPIYVSVDGRPVRSSEDADYFISWIDRLIAGAREHGGWNNAEEKEAVLRILSEGRRVYQELAGGR